MSAPRNLERARWEYPLRIAHWWQQQMRVRIEASRKILGAPFFRGDCHCHSVFSDGIGTVADLNRMKESAGLDFLFITDHWGVAQKRECVKFRNVWWGQEPPTRHHHIGILDSPRAYRTTNDLHRDIAAARKLGKLVYVAHPTGWYPVMRYTPEQLAAVATLGDEFHMEILNGANQMFDCFDVTDENSVKLWDQLLSGGKRVHALGNTDAHLPHAIGSVWNGVFCRRLTKEAILAALIGGRNFVSEAPCLGLTATSGGRRAGMGQTLRVRGRRCAVRYAAADSFGLNELRVVQDGKVTREIRLAGKPSVRGTIALKVDSTSQYVRIECAAKDLRRAFSNPVYLE